MKKRLAVLALIMICVLLVSCGQSPAGSGNGEESGSAGKNTSAEAAESSTGEDMSAEAPESGAKEESADEDVTEEASEGELLEEFEFTKNAFNQELEKPLTVCGLKFIEGEDLKFEDALNQERDSFHLHISILEIGFDMDTHLTKCQSDNADYVTSVARGYNVQQADAANGDGSAKFTVIRYTNFEDGEENDYQYMGDLVYTDGTSVASTEFMYSVDKEYGSGEEVEAAMKSITDYYGIDYEALNWVDVESRSE